MGRVKLIKVCWLTASYDYDKTSAFIKYAIKIHEVWGEKSFDNSFFDFPDASGARAYAAPCLPTEFHEAYRAFAVVHVAIVARIFCVKRQTNEYNANPTRIAF